MINGRSPAWGAAIPWVLAIAVVGVFAIDALTEQVALLPFICIPVVIAAGFASPRATAALAIATVLLTVIAGRYVYEFDGVDIWAYIGAIALISALSAWLAFRRGAIEARGRRAQRQAVATEEDFRLALQSTVNGVALIDLDGRIYSANPALSELTGRTADWLLQHEVSDLLVDESPESRAQLRAELLDNPLTTHVREHRMHLADGREGWVKESIAVMRDGDGRARGFVSQFEDVTEERSARSSLERRALRDPLTGLLNRGALLGQLESVVGHDRRRGDGTGLIYLDLDGLKAVNDTYGHATGDVLIRAAADRISRSVRAGDLVARIGGDEFVVALQQNDDMTVVAAVAEKIRTAVAEPVEADGVLVVSAASLGYAVDAPGMSVAELMSRADHALYRAKRDGGNRAVAFDAALDRMREPLPPRPRLGPDDAHGASIPG